MKDTVMYRLKLFEVTGKIEETDTPAYICQLTSILADERRSCFARKYARLWLDEIKNQQRLCKSLSRAPAHVA